MRPRYMPRRSRLGDGPLQGRDGKWSSCYFLLVASRRGCGWVICGGGADRPRGLVFVGSLVPGKFPQVPRNRQHAGSPVPHPLQRGTCLGTRFESNRGGGQGTSKTHSSARISSYSRGSSGPSATNWRNRFSRFTSSDSGSSVGAVRLDRGVERGRAGGLSQVPLVIEDVDGLERPRLLAMGRFCRRRLVQLSGGVLDGHGSPAPSGWWAGTSSQSPSRGSASTCQGARPSAPCTPRTNVPASCSSLPGTGGGQ